MKGLRNPIAIVIEQEGPGTVTDEVILAKQINNSCSQRCRKRAPSLGPKERPMLTTYLSVNFIHLVAAITSET